jgi:hypothetical protein
VHGTPDQDELYDAMIGHREAADGQDGAGGGIAPTVFEAVKNRRTMERPAGRTSREHTGAYSECSRMLVSSGSVSGKGFAFMLLALMAAFTIAGKSAALMP